MAELETAYTILAHVFKTARTYSKSWDLTRSGSLGGSKAASTRAHFAEGQSSQKQQQQHQFQKTASHSTSESSAKKSAVHDNLDHDMQITHEELGDVCLILSGTRPEDEYLEQMFEEAASFQALGGALGTPAAEHEDAQRANGKHSYGGSQSMSFDRKSGGAAYQGSFSFPSADAQANRSAKAGSVGKPQTFTDRTSNASGNKSRLDNKDGGSFKKKPLPKEGDNQGHANSPPRPVHTKQNGDDTHQNTTKKRRSKQKHGARSSKSSVKDLSPDGDSQNLSDDGSDNKSTSKSIKSPGYAPSMASKWGKKSVASVSTFRDDRSTVSSKAFGKAYPGSESAALADENETMSVRALVAGSNTFRQYMLGLASDGNFCFLLRTRLGKVSLQQLHSNTSISIQIIQKCRAYLTVLKNVTLSTCSREMLVPSNLHGATHAHLLTHAFVRFMRRECVAAWPDLFYFARHYSVNTCLHDEHGSDTVMLVSLFPTETRMQQYMQALNMAQIKLLAHNAREITRSSGQVIFNSCDAPHEPAEWHVLVSGQAEVFQDEVSPAAC